MPQSPSLSAEQISTLAAQIGGNLVSELDPASQATCTKFLNSIMSALRGGVVDECYATFASQSLELCEAFAGQQFPVQLIENKLQKLGMIPLLIGRFNQADVFHIRQEVESLLPEADDYKALPLKAVRKGAGKVSNGSTSLDLAQITGQGDVMGALATLARYTHRNPVQFEVGYGVVGVKVGGRKMGLLDAEMEPITAPEGVKVSDNWSAVMKDAKLQWQLRNYAGLTPATRKSLRALFAGKIVDALNASDRGTAESLIKMFPDKAGLHAYFAANNLPIVPVLTEAVIKR